MCTVTAIRKIRPPMVGVPVLGKMGLHTVGTFRAGDAFSLRRNGIITGARITLITKEIITGITILKSILHLVLIMNIFLFSFFTFISIHTFPSIHQSVIPHASHKCFRKFRDSVILFCSPLSRLLFYLFPDTAAHSQKSFSSPGLLLFRHNRFPADYRSIQTPRITWDHRPGQNREKRKYTGWHFWAMSEK